MRVAYLSSEVAPFAKTGGLADVAGSLPVALRALGVETAIFMPLYREVRRNQHELELLPYTLTLHQDGVDREVRFCQLREPHQGVPVYFIAYDPYFDRSQLYTENGKDYPDNLARFALYCRASLELMRMMDWRPDVVHGNDWQTALALVYCKTLYQGSPTFSRAKMLMTIHNLAFQGTFSKEQYAVTGLDWSLFGINGLEFFGKINLLKGGLIYADHITTVSKQYAKEICSEEFGCGLQGVLCSRADALSGILNGVDYSAWEPATDALIPARYSPADLSGKAANKAALQTEMGLEPSPRTPLIGMVTRLDRQKGLELVIKAFPRLMELDLQLVLLGTGDETLQAKFDALAKAYPKVFRPRFAFDNRLAHLIEAGSDIFLMPSLYEPCGLNQMYSLRYGTVPVVRKTGGLADTVQNYSATTGKGNGFVFAKPMPGELVKAVRRAVDLYRNEPERWRELMLHGMKLDFSWNASARAYEQLYIRLQRND